MIRIVEDLSADWRRLDERIECRAEGYRKVEASDSEIAHLARLGYDARANDPQSLGSAITSFLADAALNATT